MAILKGFPPSNTISPGRMSPIVAKGESQVFCNRDRLKQGRVQLHFGSWAHQKYGRSGGQYFCVPPEGTTVKWEVTDNGTFYYEWDGWGINDS
jgi:hypothetical protein